MNLIQFVDTGSDNELLVKAMNYAGLVQVSKQVRGKHGVYTRKQWVKASDVKAGEKISRVPEKPVSVNESQARNNLERSNGKARQLSATYRKGTAVSVNVKGHQLTGVVESVKMHNSASKLSGMTETTSVGLKIRTGKRTVTVNALDPSANLSKLNKGKAERTLKRKLFKPEYFMKSDGRRYTEEQVRAAYSTVVDKQVSFDDFVKGTFFISDGYTRTNQEYKDADGNYIEPRQHLHSQIVSSLLDESDPVPAGEQPVCYLLGGGSACGKSSVIKPILKSVTDATGVRVGRIDSDAIKDELPEYVPMQEQDSTTAALRVHDESSDIATMAMNAMINQRKCFAFDGTMKNMSKYESIIDQLQAGGYKIVIVGVDIPVDTAIKRSEARAAKTNRTVPEGIIRGSNGGFAAAFPELAEKVDEFYLYDNSQPFGEPPTLINSHLGVANEAKWSEFIAKGNKYRSKKGH